MKTPAGSVAAYMGPKDGPFDCGHCEYFVPQESYCVKPEVVGELGQRATWHRKPVAQVAAAGCCNFFEKG